MPLGLFACTNVDSDCAGRDPECTPFAAYIAYAFYTAPTIRTIQVDLNGDRNEDFMVGSPTLAVGGTQRGRLAIFFGPFTQTSGSINDTDADLLITGSEDNGQFGITQAVADWNQDGMQDLAVGAFTAAGGGVNRGHLYVFFGRSTWPATMLASEADLIINHTTDGAALGISVTSADLDQDGIPDLIVAANGANGPNVTNSGMIYVYTGGSSFPSPGSVDETSANLRLEGALGGGFFGQRTTAPDLTGDGIPDLLISAVREDDTLSGHSDAGALRMYAGPFTRGDTVTADRAYAVFRGGASNQAFSPIIDAGDLNNDGHVDIVGVFQSAAGGGSTRGEAYVFFGPFGGTKFYTQADITLQGTADGDQFGSFVLITNDIDGDSRPDLLVSASQAPGGGTTRGEVYVIPSRNLSAGTFTAASVASSILQGVDANERLGVPLFSQDLNGDGNLDFLLGSPTAAAGGTDRGLLMIQFSDVASTLQGTISRGDLQLTIQSTTDNSQFGLNLRE